VDVSEPFQPGASLPLTLLWRILDGDSHEYEITLTDELGKVVAIQTGNVSGAAGQYVRQDTGIELPSPMTAGKYVMRVKVLGGLPLTGGSAELGTVEVAAP
jgi:hypothetical protein